MPATTLTTQVQLLKATKISSMMPMHLGRIHGAIGGLDLVIADGATVTATRIDSAGSASGTALTDDKGNVYATFASALAAGLWELAV